MTVSCPVEEGNSQEESDARNAAERIVKEEGEDGDVDSMCKN